MRSKMASASGLTCRDQGGPLFGRALKVGSGRDAFGVERLPLARDLGLLGFQRGFRGFELRRECVGFLHALEHVRLVVADLVLGDAHLLLHRLVFLVGLHLHQLVLVLAQPALDDGEILFDLPPRRLTGRDARLDGVDGRGPLGQPRVERRLQGGNVGDSPALPFSSGVELLEVDQVFEVWMQGARRL